MDKSENQSVVADSEKAETVKNRNEWLKNARKKKDDEWYTAKSDVEDILAPFVEKLTGKKVYLPCDDWRWSNFFIVLNEHFDDWQIEEIVATHLRQNEADDGDCIRIFRGNDGTRQEEHFMLETGDCLSAECDPYWKTCEICLTNPPFSQYRPFFKRVLDAKCDFVLVAPWLIGSQEVVFKALQNDLCALWEMPDYHFWFEKPEGGTRKQVCLILTSYTETVSKLRREATDIKKRTAGIGSSRIEKVDNADIWNVPKLAMMDSIDAGDMRVFAVPITYLQKEDPEKWQTIGLNKSFCTLPAEVAKLFANSPSDKLTLHGKTLFVRMLVRRQPLPVPPVQTAFNTCRA